MVNMSSVTMYYDVSYVGIFEIIVYTCTENVFIVGV